MAKKKKQWAVPDAGPKVSMKKPKYLQLAYHIERPIYQTFMITRRELTDREVLKGLERLLELVRQGQAPEKEEGSMAPRIYASLATFLEKNPDYTPEEVAGTIKEIIGSVKFWTAEEKGGQGYLHYIEAFFSRAGI